MFIFTVSKIIIGINDVLQIVSCNDVGTLYTQNKL